MLPTHTAAAIENVSANEMISHIALAARLRLGLKSQVANRDLGAPRVSRGLDEPVMIAR
jgi:hypothetical protein